MLKFLEIKYLMVLVVASLVGIVYIQATGIGPALMANAPLVRYWDQHGRRDDGPDVELARRNIEEATSDVLKGKRHRY